MNGTAPVSTGDNFEANFNYLQSLNHNNLEALESLRPLIDMVLGTAPSIKDVDQLDFVVKLYAKAVMEEPQNKQQLLNYLFSNSNALNVDKESICELSNFEEVYEHWDTTLLLIQAKQYNLELAVELGDLLQPFTVTAQENPLVEFKLSGSPLNAAVIPLTNIAVKLITSSKELLDASDKVGLDLSYLAPKITKNLDLVFAFGSSRNNYGVCVINTTGTSPKFVLEEIISTSDLANNFADRSGVLQLVMFLNKAYHKTL